MFDFCFRRISRINLPFETSTQILDTILTKRLLSFFQKESVPFTSKRRVFLINLSYISFAGFATRITNDGPNGLNKLPQELPTILHKTYNPHVTRGQ